MTTNYRLPTNVKYTHYDLHLTPDMKNFTYTGKLAIDIDIKEDTNTLVLNYKDLEIGTAYIMVDGSNDLLQSSSVTYDSDREEVSMKFPVTLTSSLASPKLHIFFTGTINDKMAGFYRSSYKTDDGETKYCAVTQFESTDARRAFPCADEPALKARFTVSIGVPKKSQYTVLSNMPVEEFIDGFASDVYRFETTPVMSTYLLAFFVGEMDHVETTAIMPQSKNEVKVRVYTPKGESEKGKFSLELAARTLEFFSEYFDIEYPLPKMDMLGLPDFAAGAMENWGLVTYRSTLIYVTEGKTSNMIKEQVAQTVCHELAHQWFGNLVTMEWWTDLWLNEGFATWVGNMATNHFYPEWDTWNTFVNCEMGSALSLDMLKSSHPIQVTVNKASEIDEIFDNISYCKGASVIRMLVNTLGEDTFRTGLRAYLKEFQYSNAETGNLWAHLSDASGMDVATMMNSWTTKTGYPVLTVKRHGETSIEVTQERFNVADDTTWHVSLDIITSERGYDNMVKHVLTQKTEVIDLGHSWRWLKVNTECSNMCVVNYSPDLLNDLSEPVKTQTFKPVDRATLLSDLIRLNKTQHVHADVVLNFLPAYTDETVLSVVENVAAYMRLLTYTWQGTDDSLTNSIKRYTVNLFKDRFDKVGWRATEGESHNTSIERRMLVTRLSVAGYEPVLAESKRLFDLLMSGDTSQVEPDLIQTVIITGVQNGGQTEIDQVRHLFETTTEEELQGHCLTALGYVNSADHVDDCLDYSFNSGKVRTQDAYRSMFPLAEGRFTAEAWNYMVRTWDTVWKKFQGGKYISARLVSLPLQNMKDTTTLDDAVKFVESKADDLSDVRRTVDQGIERARATIKWMDYDRNSVASFFNNTN